MKKLFLSFLLLFLPLMASAYDCRVDGIYYNLNREEKTASVTKMEIHYIRELTIPEKFFYDGVEYTVISIEDNAFYNYGILTSLEIPKSLTSIGSGAFRDCSGLTSVHITDLESWCKIVFSGNDSNPLFYAHHLYLNGEEIKDLVIPSSINSIGNYAFRGFSGLTSVTIPNSITSIGNYAFCDCSGLVSVEIPNSVIDLGKYTFYNCTSLTSASLGNSVTYIGDGAFWGCSSLTSVAIPNSVTSIGDSAFRGCIGLNSMTIPNSVTSIGRFAFSGCSGLTFVEIPNSVISIGSEAFRSCSSLTSVTIPNFVTAIGDYAFAGCNNLTSVTIPSYVNLIGRNAFYGCIKLEKVYCYAERIPRTDFGVFNDSNYKNALLYVLAELLNYYKTTEPWSQFGTIKAIEGNAKKCSTPNISYDDKRLTFTCETEGVEYVSEIKDVDIRKYYDTAINLSATYEISVYASKSGFENSDVATATLVWTDAIFTVTTPETPTSAKEVKESIPVLISANGGVITVKSEQEGQAVAVYTADGKALGSATVKDGLATISTNLQQGEIVIVKVGGRSVKVKRSDF